MDIEASRHLAPCTVDDRIRHAWDAERSLDASTLHAMLQGGHIVLTGDVGCHSDRATAVGLVEQCAPMTAIENRIVVRGYDCDPQESDPTVRARVVEAIAVAVPEADSVDVRTLDHVVTIAGTISSEAERRAAHAAAARCPGVHFVVDRLAVD